MLWARVAVSCAQQGARVVLVASLVALMPVSPTMSGLLKAGARAKEQPIGALVLRHSVDFGGSESPTSRQQEDFPHCGGGGSE